MKTCIYIFTGLLLFISCSSNREPAKLSLTQNAIDMGTIKFDSSYALQYHLKNEGDVDLVIDTVTSSCGCSTPDLSKQVIAAKDSGLLSVNYKPVDTGRFTKSLVIKSNSSERFSVVTFTGIARK